MLFVYRLLLYTLCTKCSNPNEVPFPPYIPIPLTNRPKKVWASLITNLNYLPGLLTLQNSLHETGTIYPFVAFHTPSFPAVGLQVLHARGIKTHLLPALLPVGTNKYDHDPRFRETWTKLLVFSVEEYDRIVLLDGDMLVRQNIDWLMADGTADGDIGIALDNKELGGRGKRVFAAAHACACNPLKKDHYPANWYLPYSILLFPLSDYC